MNILDKLRRAWANWNTNRFVKNAQRKQERYEKWRADHRRKHKIPDKFNR
jgi:hypothetical protein